MSIPLQVAVGVILDKEQRVLIAKRASHQTYSGLWEFPGGKVEAHETVEAALCRELKEEVGLCVEASRYLGEVETHSSILLLIFLVEKWTGEGRCLEKQMDLRWVKWNELSDYDFPKANQKIIEMLEQKVFLSEL